MFYGPWGLEKQINYTKVTRLISDIFWFQNPDYLTRLTNAAHTQYHINEVDGQLSL